MKDEMLAKRRTLCLTNFHNKYMERIVNHYASMQQNGINHFLYYEPGIMFLGWLTQPNEKTLTFNAKFCDEANTKDNIEQALINFYTRHNAKRILLINEFDNIVVTDPGQEPIVSPLERALQDKDTGLNASVLFTEIDREEYKVINFGEGLEEKIFEKE